MKVPPRFSALKPVIGAGEPPRHEWDGHPVAGEAKAVDPKRPTFRVAAVSSTAFQAFHHGHPRGQQHARDAFPQANTDAAASGKLEFGTDQARLSRLAQPFAGTSPALGANEGRGSVEPMTENQRAAMEAIQKGMRSVPIRA